MRSMDERIRTAEHKGTRELRRKSGSRGDHWLSQWATKREIGLGGDWVFLASVDIISYL